MPESIEKSIAELEALQRRLRDSIKYSRTLVADSRKLIDEYTRAKGRD